MIKLLSVGTLILVLLVGEMMTVYTGILSHMNTEEISLMVAVFAGIWIIFVLVSEKIGRIVKG